MLAHQIHFMVKVKVVQAKRIRNSIMKDVGQKGKARHDQKETALGTSECRHEAGHLLEWRLQLALSFPAETVKKDSSNHRICSKNPEAEDGYVGADQLWVGWPHVAQAPGTRRKVWCQEACDPALSQVRGTGGSRVVEDGSSFSNHMLSHHEAAAHYSRIPFSRGCQSSSSFLHSGFTHLSIYSGKFLISI